MKNRSLVLLSGEETTVPAAEAKSLFLAYDRGSKFTSPWPRVLLAESDADPYVVGRRIAFARRVGPLVEDTDSAADMMRGKRVRFRVFDLVGGRAPPDPESFLSGVEARVDLRNPERELTLVRARQDYLAVTSPLTMQQGWSERRPRRRPFFHPAAIFPKLSRALVNLTRCREGDTFLDPFAGTGSLALEAFNVGAKVVTLDQVGRMTAGEVANMRRFGQEWLGAVRADATNLPLIKVDAVATDIPYGRASSTRGRTSRDILGRFIPAIGMAMRAGTYLALMHQKEVEVEPSPWFSTLEEHDLHVHKLLTRTISILRRT